MDRKIISILGTILIFLEKWKPAFKQSFPTVALLHWAYNQGTEKGTSYRQFYLPSCVVKESHSAQIHLKAFFLMFKTMVNGRTVYASTTLASPPIFKGPTCPLLTLSSLLSQNDMTTELRND